MTRPNHRRDGEDGYLLLWLVVVCFLLLLGLSVAAPRVAKELERDKELESEHRAQEYVRAIQLYYRKNNSYPTSLEQLLGSGSTGVPTALNIKYLRQQYKDPLTHADFRLIHLGEAKTEVKGFFGDPLPGMPVGTLGSASGSQSNLAGGSNFGSSGSAFGSSTPTTAGGTGATSPTTAAGAPPSTGAGGASSVGTPSSGSTPFGGSGTSATSFQGSKGGIVGVGSDAKGPGLVEWNGSADIADWEFLYDPRVEALKAKVSIFGGSPAASGSGNIGSGFAPAAGINGPTGAAGTFGATPTPGSTSPGTGAVGSPITVPPATNP
jgi:type II secretory pathway pseudopilin PulG